MDFFSAIFDNQDSDDEENAEEETKGEKKADEIPQPVTTIISAPLTLKPTVLPIIKQSHVEISSDSSDSSIEEIEAPGKESK